VVKIPALVFFLDWKMFGALAFIFIVLWLMLDYGAEDAYSARTKRGKTIGRVCGVIGFVFLAIQILQWAQVIQPPP
jgi:hypothetical protein